MTHAGLEQRRILCHGRVMARRNALSGGFFITFGSIAGLIVGTLIGGVMEGVAAGTALGIAAALLVWLIDRRR